MSSKICNQCGKSEINIEHILKCCINQPTMNQTPREEKLGELVRDLTSVGIPRPKSEVRRRINDLIQSAIETEREKLKGVAEWVGHSYGMSSVHLFQHMMGVKIGHEYAPLDEGDRGRCVVLLKAVPEWTERLDEMKQYQDWAEQIPLIKEALLTN